MDTLNQIPKEVLHFTIQETIACIDLQVIQQALLLPMLTPIPESPSYIAGILNFGGTSVVVIDLALALNMKRQSLYNIDTTVLLCSLDGKLCGMIIDKILGLAPVKPEQYQLMDGLYTANSSFIASIYYANTLSLLIDTKKVITKCLNMVQTMPQNMCNKQQEVM